MLDFSVRNVMFSCDLKPIHTDSKQLLLAACPSHILRNRLQNTLVTVKVVQNKGMADDKKVALHKGLTLIRQNQYFWKPMWM